MERFRRGELVFDVRDSGPADGPAVVLLRCLSGPNEVLVSSTLRDLVIGSGLEFEERGAHQLKGVPGEWRLFAVASP